MATTIQLQEETVELLKRLRKETHASSYDEAIRKMLTNSAESIQSYYGFLGKRSTKQILENLRDKSDRL